MEDKAKEEKEKEIAEDYVSSLADLNLNSKPLINVLTIVAEENLAHAAVIVKVIEQHISKVNSDVKLPVLYLIDSIVKNVGDAYIQIFSHCIVNIFCGVFEKVNEKIREKMYTLRQTWNDVFPAVKLYTLDVKVNCIDPNWPITAKILPKSPAIHVNPNFLIEKPDGVNADIQSKLQLKQFKILELQKKKLELELEHTRKKLQQADILPKIQQQTTEVNAPSTSQSAKMGLRPPQPNVHVNRNLYNNQFRPQLQGSSQRPVAPTSFGGYPVQNPPSQNNRPKIAPVNPIMINTLNKRDPRLARQAALQQDSNINQITKDSIPNNNQHLENDSEKGFRAIIENNDLKKQSEETKDSTKVRPKIVCNINTSLQFKRLSKRDHNGKSAANYNVDNKLKSSIKSDNKSLSISPQKHYSDKNKKSPSDRKRPKESFNIPSQKKDEKSPKSQVTNRLVSSPIKKGQISPKNSRFKEFKATEHKSRNYMRRNKELSNSPSPTKDMKAEKIENSSSDKSVKIITPTKNETSMTTSIVEKLEQNSDEKPADIDLRIIQTPPNNLANKYENLENSTIADASSRPSVSPTTKILIERAEEIRSISGKKRPSVDLKIDCEEPLTKKTKAEKIDNLFGSEDVDLRVDPTLLNSVAAPPPPIISTENENWAKVKATTPTTEEKISPMRSSLDDVRAKLAKAAKTNNYKFGAGNKNRKGLLKQFISLESNEDSQDASDDHIRIIINQAQELLESNNIDKKQYNALVQTVVQINETNKLKEAKRRESLQDNKKDDQQENKKIFGTKLSDELNKSKPKEQRKRIPKIPKISEAVNENIDKNKIAQDLDSKNSTEPTNRVEPANRHETSKRNDAGPRVEPNKVNEMSYRSESSSRNEAINQNDSPNRSEVIDKDVDSRRKRSKETKWGAPNNLWNNKNPQQLPQPWARPADLLPTFGPSNQVHRTNNNPWQNPPMAFSNNQMQPMQFNGPPQLSVAVSQPNFSNSIDNPQANIVRTIPIDGVAKEIRIYHQVAIAFMDWDQPREIGFENGQRRVCIDNEEPVSLNFNDDFKTIKIQGQTYRIKYGFPSRELYVDDNWYECYFGGPPLTIPLADGKLHIVKIEGPPPQVNIGALRQDLVVGKINLIVDAHIIIPVFLDAKIQTFELDGVNHSIQFADALATVFFNNEPHTFEYGGLPKSIKLSEKKYFIRFAALPNGITPGKVNIKDMILTKGNKQNLVTDEVTPPVKPIIELKEEDVILKSGEDRKPNEEPITNVIEAESSDIYPPLPLSSVNIDDLFQKLLASGILNNKSKEDEEAKEAAKEEADSKNQPPINSIDLSRTETIKTRQSAIVHRLFCGMQCGSCGLRFPPEQTIKYSQHLDWHFRQNRRERDLTRKAHNRKWYYDLADWIQYEEIEDIEDREKNWFESQQQIDIDNMDENSNLRTNSPVPTCPAGPDDVDRSCDLCNEKFDQFYNEELEEWHLKSAVRVDDQIYHPICYQDLKAANEKVENEEPQEEEKKEEELSEIIEVDDSVILVKQEKSEEDKKSIEDEDDDVIVLPNEEPSITEILDDDEPMFELKEKDTENDLGNKVAEDSSNDIKELQKQNVSIEDDIVIEEPNIPFTDLDTYIEKDLSNLNNDDSSQLSFQNVKIKDEPKDDDIVDENDDEEDAFEEVGTLTGSIEILQDSSGAIIETTLIEDDSGSHSNSIIINTNTENTANISMDGNVKVNDVQTTTLANRIRINIANLANNNSNSSNNKIVNELNNKNLNNTIEKSPISTIPVITSSSNSASFSSNTINLNMNSNLISLTSSNNNDVVITSSTTSDADDSLTITTETPNIEYNVKPELKNIDFKVLSPTKSGHETSGLCSIM